MSKEINEGKGMHVLPGSLTVEQSFCIAGLGNPSSARKIFELCGRRRTNLNQDGFFLLNS